MDSSHELKIALTKIRLMADISRDAQCKADECLLVMEMISELAEQVLVEDENDQFASCDVIFKGERQNHSNQLQIS